MIQRTVDIQNEAELLWMISAVKDTRHYDEKGTFLLQIYLSRFSSDEAKEVIKFIQKELPAAKIVGMSLYGDQAVNLNNTKFIRFNTCQFEETDVTVFEYDHEQMTEEEIIIDFRNQLSKIPDAKAVLLLGSGLDFKISKFMKEVPKDYEDIPFFGSVANINSSDIDSIYPYAFASHVINCGIVAAVFSGKNLKVTTESVFGWNPIGKPLEVECGQPNFVGDTLITKIDSLPAAQIYKKYLNVDPDAHFISNICEFPLVFERNGYLIPRVPCGYNDKGELNTMGDVISGEKVRFTYGKTDDILKKSWEASTRMALFAPEAIFLFVCANRAIFMKERAHEEIDYFTKISPGALFCHGFAELYRYNNQGGVFNSQLVIVGLREGGKEFESRITNIPNFSFDIKKKEDVKDTEPKTVLDYTFDGSSQVKNGDSSHHSHSMLERPFGKAIPLADRLVTFLEATTDELKKMTETANSANEAKSAFLSSMSHEIRSPINAVLGLDEMILRESNENAIKGYARDIQSSGKSLLSIINDILDFSKIEAGKMDIIPDGYDLRSTITDLANMVETRAKHKNLDFIITVDESMPHHLYGDETRIKQCALNILTNAVKYTRKGSVRLNVSFKKIDEEKIGLKIQVVDTGIGFREEDLEQLYKPFERIEENRNRSIEGTGLGMSIVHGLLTQMGTKLEVKSVYGKGSDFSFIVEQKVTDWEKIGTKEESKAALLKEATTYSESFQAPDAKILVVDDTVVNLTVAKGLLKKTRIQIDTAESGAEALNLVRENKYDILFVDHLMPKMDGIEFLAANFMDADSKNKNTPAVALTANAVSGAKDFYLSSGFDNYLSKPIDPKKLEEMVAKYLPREKVILHGDKRFVEVKVNEWDGVERRENVCEVSDLFGEFFGIEIDQALKNCGGKDVFKTAVKNFYESIDEKSELIEKYEKDADWKNYTVFVHALKSSARLLGANELSELAKELEAYGDFVQKNPDESEKKALIREKTPRLLADYRAYKRKLGIFAGKSAPESESEDFVAAKNSISKERLNDAFAALKELVSAFDFDSADAIISELEKYELPADSKELFEKVRRAVQKVDAKEVIDLLES
ncbi:MAG: response regulator [Treponema sp.]|nr:response regulator [Treponema sp.]